MDRQLLLFKSLKKIIEPPFYHNLKLCGLNNGEIKTLVVELLELDRKKHKIHLSDSYFNIDTLNGSNIYYEEHSGRDIIEDEGVYFGLITRVGDIRKIVCSDDRFHYFENEDLISWNEYKGIINGKD